MKISTRYPYDKKSNGSALCKLLRKDDRGSFTARCPELKEKKDRIQKVNQPG